MFFVRCPFCQSDLECDESCLGSVVACTVCQSELEIMMDGSCRPLNQFAAQPQVSMPNNSYNQGVYGAPAPAPEPPPAPVPVPKKKYSNNSSNSGSSGSAFILAVLALIISIASAVFFYFRTEILSPVKFYTDPVEAATASFEREITTTSKMNTNQNGYLLSKLSAEAIKNYKVDIKEKGKYAVAFWETTINRNTFYGHDWFVQNKDGYYVKVYSPGITDMTSNELKWYEDMKERIEKHEKDNKDFSWDMKTK